MRRLAAAIAVVAATVWSVPAASTAEPASPGAADEHLPGGLRITVTELTDRAGRPLVSALRINDRGQVLGTIATETGYQLVVLHRGRATPVAPEGVAAQYMEFSGRGQVVGVVHDYATYSSRAFSSVDGRFEWLPAAGYQTSVATAVNDRGQVLGYRVRASSSAMETVVWQDGRVVTMPAPPPSPMAFPVAINDRGQAVVGSLLWQVGGGATDLGDLGRLDSTGQGADANERAEVAGQSQTADRSVHAYRWRDGVMTDLGTLGGRHSDTLVTPMDDARVINERGHVVGQSHTTAADGDRTAAFLWRDGEMVEVGSPDHLIGTPGAINDRDQVVGTSASYGGPIMAWLWQDGRLVDLGALLGEGSASAQDINERGQIVGTYDGRAVMWTVR